MKATSKSTRLMLERALGLLLLACTLTGCVEAVSWAAFGLYAAQDFTQFIPQAPQEGTSPYTKDWPGFCALPDTQTVRPCNWVLRRQGWVRVEVDPDGQWRPVAPQNVGTEKEN